MEASTPTPAAHGDPSRKKRALELGRPAFVAREDGAYHDVEMPKKHRCGYNGVAANPRYCARLHLLTDDGGGTAGNKRGLGPTSRSSSRRRRVAAPTNMPKKYKCEYMADPERSVSPRTNALDADEAGWLAMLFRILRP
ncbi:hypothetical protein PVAP13_3KG362662 [Panicum virgatum]|uniref:Uncharacterized protein n=1 Tax=Panicum virgatum TaxID=38727 RepID=A0A8T0UJH2_PANVG|nr:hypothetical protein PVAP13_3KG362662 [Panicum virgatum]